MGTAERIEAIRAFLEENEYEPKVKRNGVVRFKNADMTMFVQTDAEDETFYRIGLPDFWPLETEKEKERAPRVMHDTMARENAIKLLTVNGDTWCVIEAFHPTAQDLLTVLKDDIRRIMHGVTSFAQGILRDGDENSEQDREDR